MSLGLGNSLEMIEWQVAIEMTKDFIQRVLGDKGDKGRLHRALGVPKGEPIGNAKLRAAANSKRKFEGSSVAKMAQFALRLKEMR